MSHITYKVSIKQLHKYMIKLVKQKLKKNWMKVPVLRIIKQYGSEFT